MKIWCDVCDKEEASVFCCADEAALCNGCDRHVHSANKLAGKHLRFSLSSPTFKDAPLCDICGERRALLFCQEDRRILCRECDIQIHKANEHTKKHNRFLLTGIKLSAFPSSAGEVPSSVSSEVFESLSPSTTASNCYYGIDENYHQGTDSGSGGISNYLMEGWRVEDLLDYPSCIPFEDNSESYRFYDASLQYHHQGFWEQKPFS